MRYIIPALLVLASSTAFAQTSPAGSSFGLAKIFDEADTNKDGVVTKEEFLAKAERHFGMADTNKDGKITREEMQAQQNAVMQQMQQNMFGKGANWQGKLNEFLGQTGTTQAVPTTPVVTSPSAPVVIPPAAPTAPTTY